MLLRLVPFIFLMLISCKSTEKPASTDMIVFVHGLFGSKLVDKKDRSTVWINFSEAVFGGRRVNLPIEGLERFPHLDLEPIEVMPKITIVPWLFYEDGYGPTLDFLHKQGEVVPFFYDWRKNLDEPATKLRALLGKLTSENKKVWVIAHSMGGLVAMQALRYENDKEDWSIFEKLQGVVISATPSWGSMAAFRNMNSSINIGPNKRIVDAVAYSSFESVYYMMPRGPADLLLNEGVELQGEVAQSKNWRERRWGMLAMDEHEWTASEMTGFKKYAQHWLDKTQKFSDRLHAPVLTKPKRIPKIYFLRGRGVPTTAKLHLSADFRPWYWDYDLKRYVPGKDMSILNDDGDGSVSMVSSAVPLPWKALGATERIEALGHAEMMNDSKIHEYLAKNFF